MDRDFGSKDIDSTKVKDLLDKIKKAEGIAGSDLNTMMSTKAQHSLEKFLDDGLKKVQSLG